MPHINRDSTVKLLEGLKVLKMKRVTELRSSEIIAALEEVVAKVKKMWITFREYFNQGCWEFLAGERGGGIGAASPSFCCQFFGGFLL